MNKLLLMGCLLLQSVAAGAATTDHTRIRDTVIAFVQQQTAALPGKTRYQIDEIDSRISLSECARLEAFLPAGSQFVGKISVGVRCVEKNGWSIFVPTQIKLSLDLLASTRQLPMGHTLREEDFTTQTTEVSSASGFTDPKQVLGQVLRYNISAGQLLRADMLRPPYSVTQRQAVQIFAQGNGFSIRNEGAALNNAGEGQSVQVRVGSGRVIGGIARAGGAVEINP
ncbi:MAG TPA: flagellar basal body P-ring formation chaperone FlgA [Gallionella sp.]|nr:flagellar basal body P-ring formation chaperone FlgA [Gallionella sp.]